MYTMTTTPPKDTRYYGYIGETSGGNPITEYRTPDGRRIVRCTNVYTVYDQNTCMIPTKRLHKSRKRRM